MSEDATITPEELDAGQQEQPAKPFVARWQIVSAVVLLAVIPVYRYLYPPVMIDLQAPCVSGNCPMKPVIYLYPLKKEDVKVAVEYKGGLNTTYPAYDYDHNGWKVTAHPDGKLENTADGQEYSYLFWDGGPYDIKIDETQGFVVEGIETAQFLRDTLSRMGLTPKEYNEFIVYWLPRMRNNPYNFIHFAGKEYTDVAKLHITPEPDSVQRVFMVYKPLRKAIRVTNQQIEPFKRHGFTVIEWGGMEIQ